MGKMYDDDTRNGLHRGAAHEVVALAKHLAVTLPTPH